MTNNKFNNNGDVSSSFGKSKNNSNVENFKLNSKFNDPKFVLHLNDMLRVLKTDFVEIIEEMHDHLHNQSFIDRNNSKQNLDKVEQKMYVETHSEQIDW